MQKKQNPKKYDACLKTPFANLGLRFEEGVLVSIDYIQSGLKAKPVSDEARQVCQQIKNYYSKRPTENSFDVQLQASGTHFQKRVWKALQKIPLGTVVTYGDLAKRLKTSPRAVGNACRKNPISVIIPCHRVVSKTSLGGYSGKTSGRSLKIKEWLLKHESAISGH
jgi:methylated-DNA-[protein]-cysteine S-methyltransferase